MKELVLISGKGGTGKTCLASSFAFLASHPVICDCDVEAPNLHILLQPEIQQTSSFSASRKAHLDVELCIYCGLCMEMCRFDAIQDYQVSPLDCEGCAFCSRLCPVGAIRMEEHCSGEWYTSDTELGPMLHARLGIGEQNSGKLVALLRKQAREVASESGRELIITDGPPGTGCPTIATISGCDLAAIITEPTLSAIHDMKRAMELCRHFKVKSGVIINKYDLNPIRTQEIREFCTGEGVPVLGGIPFREDFTLAVNNCQPPVKYSPDIARIMQRIWKEVEVSLHE